MTVRRKTQALVQLATVLMENPAARHYGYDMAKQAGIRSATLYRLLGRMHDDGWLTDGWEESSVASRPRRRYYTVTELGAAKLLAIVGHGVGQT